jgi:hypothetical protein
VIDKKAPNFIAKKRAEQVIQAPVLPYIFFAQLGLALPEVYN